MPAAQTVARAQVPDSRADEVLVQLARILKSNFFRGSRKCSHFLDFCVQHTLRGDSPEEMRERIIGVEVFGRPSDYDASADPVVRVTANEVRKRLAQYYTRADVQDNVVISLPPGSYAAAFEWKSVIAQPVEPRPTARSNGIPLGRLAVAILIPVMGAVAVLAYRGRTRADALQSGFWSPVLKDSKSVLICMDQPMAYGIKGQEGGVFPPRSESTFPLGTEPPLFARAIPLPPVFVGIGDAHAVADITSFLGQQGKPWKLHIGETTAADLRDGPLILIGYENPWTSKLMEQLPFVFQNGHAIRDRIHPGIEWKLSNVSADYQSPEDYAIVSRFLSPETGEPVIVVAGLVNFGTQAAGEFITSPKLLAPAMRDAPTDWLDKELSVGAAR